MTDKQFEATKRRVQALLNEWAFGTKARGPRLMALKDWVIKVAYRRDSFETSDGDIAGAQVTSMWHYKNAEIEFNCSEIHNLSDLELELLVIHELCHALVNEMREWGTGDRVTDGNMHHEEHVVTNLALAFLQTKYWDQNLRRKKLEGDEGRKK